LVAYSVLSVVEWSGKRTDEESVVWMVFEVVEWMKWSRASHLVNKTALSAADATVATKVGSSEQRVVYYSAGGTVSTMADLRDGSEMKLVWNSDQLALLWAVRWEKSVEPMVAYLVLKTAETKVASTDSCLDSE